MGKQGLQSYYQQKIEELEVVLRDKEQNVRRLEAQRNEWNARGLFLSFFLPPYAYYFQVRFIKEELTRLQEAGAYVGEVVKVMGKDKVLVKVHSHFSSIARAIMD